MAQISSVRVPSSIQSSIGHLSDLCRTALTRPDRQTRARACEQRGDRVNRVQNWRSAPRVTSADRSGRPCLAILCRPDSPLFTPPSPAASPSVLFLDATRHASPEHCSTRDPPPSSSPERSSPPLASSSRDVPSLWRRQVGTTPRSPPRQKLQEGDEIATAAGLIPSASAAYISHGPSPSPSHSTSPAPLHPPGASPHLSAEPGKLPRAAIAAIAADGLCSNSSKPGPFPPSSIHQRSTSTTAEPSLTSSLFPCRRSLEPQRRRRRQPLASKPSTSRSFPPAVDGPRGCAVLH